MGSHLSSLPGGSGCGSVDRAFASDTEVPSLNPVIGEFLFKTFIYFQLYLKDKLKKKGPGVTHLKTLTTYPNGNIALIYIKN